MPDIDMVDVGIELDGVVELALIGAFELDAPPMPGISPMPEDWWDAVEVPQAESASAPTARAHVVVRRWRCVSVMTFL